MVGPDLSLCTIALTLFEKASNGLFQFIYNNRLDQVCLCACIDSGLSIRLAAGSRVKNDRHLRIEFANLLTQLNPAPVRQPIIQNAKVKCTTSQPLQRLSFASNGHYRVA